MFLIFSGKAHIIEIPLATLPTYLPSYLPTLVAVNSFKTASSLSMSNCKEETGCCGKNKMLTAKGSHWQTELKLTLAQAHTMDISLSLSLLMKYTISFFKMSQSVSLLYIPTATQRPPLIDNSPLLQIIIVGTHTHHIRV